MQDLLEDFRRRDRETIVEAVHVHLLQVDALVQLARHRSAGFRVTPKSGGGTPERVLGDGCIDSL